MGATLEIGDDVLWGKLVKSWATGRNYVVPDGARFLYRGPLTNCWR